MGCDIHAIVEIRKNGEWELVNDLPEVFDSRSYGVFSILNRNVRNGYGIDGFEGKGKPSDSKNVRARFNSCRADIENAYKKKSQFCRKPKDNGEIEYISIYSNCLIVDIDDDLYEHLSKGMTEEEKKRYALPYKNSDGKAQVHDAFVVNGEFVEVPYSEVYPTIKQFNDEFYKYPWFEEEQDFGYYEFDLVNRDYHSHSYLNLKEMKTKNCNFCENKVFLIEDEFLELLSAELRGDTSFLELGDIKDGKREVRFVEDDIAYIWRSYENGVREMENIKNKYNIENDTDIRLVFAFDS